MSALRSAILLMALLWVGPVQAGGDFAEAPVSSRCTFVEDAQVLMSYQDMRELREEVERRYDHAVAVATDQRTIYSRSPLFVWAGQAKISCAQAIGYLRKRWKWRRRPNYDTLQKCDCFYDRMTQYLGR